MELHFERWLVHCRGFEPNSMGWSHPIQLQKSWPLGRDCANCNDVARLAIPLGSGHRQGCPIGLDGIAAKKMVLRLLSNCKTI